MVIEQNAAAKNEKAPPERDEDGTFFDKAYQAMHIMSDTDMAAELEGKF